MGPRGKFGHHPAILFVNCLSGNNIAEYFGVVDYGCGCIVARGFNPKNVAVFLCQSERGIFIGCKIKTLKAYQKTSENNSSHLCNHCIAARAYSDYFFHSIGSDLGRKKSNDQFKRDLRHRHPHKTTWLELERRGGYPGGLHCRPS